MRQKRLGYAPGNEEHEHRTRKVGMYGGRVTKSFIITLENVQSTLNLLHVKNTQLLLRSYHGFHHCY